MINNVVLVGRLTKDVEYQVTPSGIPVAKFTLAVNRNFKSQNSEQQADFINIVTFRKTAEVVNQYCSKGSLVGVQGRMQSRSYENNEGRKVYVTEVVADSVQFLESKKDSQQNQQQQPQSNPFANQPQQQQPQQQYHQQYQQAPPQQYQAQPQQQYQAPPQQNHYNNPATSDFDSDNPPF
ncbi:single-stranded DNA-binding protein [Macrococcus bovicus]|uniref:Single-stranded DNA-binding protein n=1 Tax=Macrococcus bovicus TaxID=69968 RepID=A0A4R6BWI5_9STAP|nr:single-stranded DNA-binding protein [Macrococcus bovicus]TDM12688.1 single-stranded DNA-binding protein [Macrococcus bovicus]